MKKIFTLTASVFFSYFLHAQVICGTANEGGTVTLTAPPGNYITSIEFASYGTPNGSCGSFTTGGCHAANSVSICSSVFIGQNSASIGATNGVFGDPCGGTVKRLYVQATYSTILPVTLVSFTAEKSGEDKVKLEWISDHEINTAHFDVERSNDGVTFRSEGIVLANGNGGYSFINMISIHEPVYFYRLKMVDADDKFRYSNIVRVSNGKNESPVSIFPNPATDLITISGNKQEEVFIANASGQVMHTTMLINGSKTINISSWLPGIYLIRTNNNVLKFIKN